VRAGEHGAQAEVEGGDELVEFIHVFQAFATESVNSHKELCRHCEAQPKQSSYERSHRLDCFGCASQ
jgi:hypothetical protein